MYRKKYNGDATAGQLQLRVGDAYRFLNASTTFLPGLNLILSQHIQTYRDRDDTSPSNVFDLLDEVRLYVNGPPYQSILRLMNDALNLRYDPQQGVRDFTLQAERIYRDMVICFYGENPHPVLFYYAFRSLPPPMLPAVSTHMHVYDSKEAYEKYDFNKVLKDILAATPPDLLSAEGFHTRPEVGARTLTSRRHLQRDLAV